MEKLRILVVDNEKEICDGIEEFLSKRNYDVTTIWNPEEAFSRIEKEQFEIAIFDINLGALSGIDLLKKFKEIQPDSEAIMITGRGDQQSIIESMRNGAYDFFNKPVSLSELQASIKRTARYAKLQSKFNEINQFNSLLSKDLKKQVGDIIGTSPAIGNVINLALKAADFADTNVLITGPNGCGKELVARVIHYASRRKDRFFIPVNSAAIPESLMESEFFGHRKGAFTGALENREGYFEAVKGGTLFLDEIGDMDYNIQAKILRILEDRKVKRIGENIERDFDARIVSATNQHIETLIDENKFRRDLFYRLNTIEIPIPPLKDRPEDIRPLLEFFIGDFSSKLGRDVTSYEPVLIEALESYHFPGNIRELRNMVERAIIVSDGKVLRTADFILPATKHITPVTPPSPEIDEIAREGDESLNLDELVIGTIKKAMARAQNNKSKAAEYLGISRYALDRKLKKYDELS